MILCGLPVSRAVCVHMCPLAPGVNPAVAKRTGLCWSLVATIWLVWMNHGRTYCASSDQMSSGCLADTELGFPKRVLEVGRKAHSGKVCHLHEGLCVHASSLSPFFAMGMYSVGPSLPSPRRLLGLGWGRADGASNLVPTASPLVSCP